MPPNQTYSPKAAAVLELDWLEADWPVEDRGEYGTSVLPLSTLFSLSDEKGKPALVYVFDAETDEEKLEKVEQKTFGREDFLITTKFFRCFRIEDDTVPAESRKLYSGKLPAFFVLDTKGNIVAQLQGRKVSTKTLIGQMNKGFDKKTLKTAKKAVKAYRKHLAEFQVAEDAVAIASQKVSDVEERLEKKDSPSARKQLAEAKVKLGEAREKLTALVKKGREILDLTANDAVAKR